MVYCTLGDKKYKRQMELLIESAKVRFNVLCLDDETYHHFAKRKDVSAYHYNDIQSEVLKIHHQTHNWEQHCWALASYFLRWLRNNGAGNLIYVDADIYFYKNINYIEVQKSIGIIEHRFKSYDPKRKVGHYNVGVIYFADDKAGNECLEWWNNVVMNDNNEFYEDYGSCGDQKYLELFQVFWPNDWEVLDVGHAAPWNTHQRYEIHSGDRCVTFQGLVQPLVFFHFSHFSVSGDGYRTQRNGEWHPERTWAKELYDEYYIRYNSI